MLTWEFEFWIVADEKQNVKIIPYATVLKESKYGNVTLMHCDARKKWLIHVTFQKFLIIENSRSPSKLHRINRHQ